MTDVKQIFTQLLPPKLIDFTKFLVRHNGYFGDYATWEEARQASGGYDVPDILEKVKQALLKVKNGESVYERDSVLFDRVEYSWPVLASLLWIAAQNESRLNLLDFGGSLGSSYFQNKFFLQHLNELRWSIVEQPSFVDCGRRYFADQYLMFYDTLDTCLRQQIPDTILLSSVLQYIENPYSLLKEIIGKGFRYIIVDRTPFVRNGIDRITIQKVPAKIYKASYPAWFFDQRKFLDFICHDYQMVTEFTTADRANISSEFKGYLFKKREV